jgi:hypothetical protein
MSLVVFLALSSSYIKLSKKSSLEVSSINSSFINIGSSGLLLNYRRAPSFLLLINNPILLSSKPKTSTSSYKDIYKSETLIRFYF